MISRRKQEELEKGQITTQEVKGFLCSPGCPEPCSADRAGLEVRGPPDCLQRAGSKASPWGSYIGTWQMPLKIPPAKANLTARTTAAADSLTEWIHKNPDLLNACNGLRPEIIGKPRDLNSQKKQKKSVTKTVQQALNPTIIPSSPVIQGDNPDEPQSSHPSAGHTPGPQTPLNSPKNPPPSPS
uniref:Protein Flattop n=1 Tax=Rattus norvegicus TaxID=10116 RepID=A0A8I6AGN8_RAT